MASTLTLQNTITWAKGFVGQLDPTVMLGAEPAITSANMVKLTMLGPPFVWRWNRAVTGFVAAAGVQDYALGSWAQSVSVAANSFIVDINGNSQQVQSAGITGAVVPTWNVSVNGTTTDNSVTWVNRGVVSGAGPSYTFNFVETASVQDISAPVKWFEMSPKLCLGLDSTQARPRDIAAQKDDNAGNLTFRLLPTPDKAYPVAITVQQKSPLFFANINTTWAPIPDEYSYIYNWGFLTMVLLYGDDPRWGMANQKFVSALLGAQQGLTETERNIFLNNWQAIIGQPAQNMMRMQQGNNMRGV